MKSTISYLKPSIIAYMSIGDRLKELREEAQLTQEQMADIVGTSKQYVGRLEKGFNKNPNGGFITGWARYFSVSAHWLSTGEGPRAANPAPSYQPVRPDPAILLATQGFLEKAYSGLGKKFSLMTDADLFADVYEWIVEDDRPVDQRNLVDFAQWRAKRDEHGGVDEQNGHADGQAAGADRRRAAG